MRHAVILAGGSGTRLWPLSRRSRPKQLLRLFNNSSLLQLARRRLASLFPPERIYVVTSAVYLDQVAEELPDLPRANLIGEPIGRDTANAIGLAAHTLALRDPDGTMAVFTADHLISPEADFVTAIAGGLAAAEQYPDSLVTFGVRPDSPHTGYGYVGRGAPIAPSLFHVKQFCEKPNRQVAESYVASGEYFWNSGMFAWRIKTLIRAMTEYLPRNHAMLADLARDWDALAGTPELADRFGQLPRISIDYGIMEKHPYVLMAELNCKWLDVGSFRAVAAAAGGPDAQGNSAVGAALVELDAKNNIAVSEDNHLIALLGVDDLVVVHSPDATLVCRRDMAERIKELVPRTGRE